MLHRVNSTGTKQVFSGSLRALLHDLLFRGLGWGKSTLIAIWLVVSTQVGLSEGGSVEAAEPG